MALWLFRVVSLPIVTTVARFHVLRMYHVHKVRKHVFCYRSLASHLTRQKKPKQEGRKRGRGGKEGGRKKNRSMTLLQETRFARIESQPALPRGWQGQVTEEGESKVKTKGVEKKRKKKNHAVLLGSFLAF